MSTITKTPAPNTANTRATTSAAESTKAPETAANTEPAPVEAKRALGLHGHGDAFDSDEITSTNTRPRSMPSTSSGAPVGDPALLAQMSSARASANAGGRIKERTAKEPVVGEAPGGIDVAEKKSKEAQKAFCAEMKAAGIEASQPPTPEQLEAYFKTFDNPTDRPKALEAYQRYSNAYHVHIESAPRADFEGTKDVKYSPETHYAVDGKIIGTNKDDAQAIADKKMNAGKDVVFDKLPTRDASSWEDVTTKRKTDAGRYVNDCEGFAFSAEKLLGAAGYKTEQVAVQGGPSGNHAMTVLVDPSRKGELHVASNGDIFPGKSGPKGQRALLDQAFDAAGGTSKGAKYFYGDTQALAQAKMQLTTLQ